MKPEARARYLGTSVAATQEKEKEKQKRPEEAAGAATAKKELVETQIKREKVDLSLESVKVQLKDLNEKRVRAKIKEYGEHIELINRMLDAHPNDFVLRAHIISSLFQAHSDNPSSTVINEFLTSQDWEGLLDLLSEMLATLIKFPKIELYEFTGRAGEEDAEPDSDSTLRGSMVGFYQYLDDQLFKALKFTRGGTQEYSLRLRALWRLIGLGESLWEYYRGLSFQDQRKEDHKNISLA